MIAPLLAVLALLLVAPHAEARTAKKPWPPDGGRGLLFVHYGEEHWNDDDSEVTLQAVVDSSARYAPDLVTMSGDKDNNGTVDQLTRWKQIMSAYDQARIPYLAGVGNHDRDFPLLPGTAGLLTPGVQGSLSNYREIFADRPYPFGDAAPYEGIGPARPPGDPTGASSHYYADIGSVRWIFIDNSCWGIVDCDEVQQPNFPDADGNSGQFEFLEQKATEATRDGRHVFVVMHIPTRDPRDQSYIDVTSFDHVMGKGIGPGAADNSRFEDVAAATGVDGVFVGHIKGQWLYRGEGNVPYYIDGGAGGELYTDGPTGTDHGYWHGYRLVRVRGGRITTDVVPVIDAGGIEIEGPGRLAVRERVTFAANATLTKTIGPSIVVGLHDPDPIPPSGNRGALAAAAGFLEGDGGMMLVPALALLLAVGVNAIAPIRRRSAAIAPLAGLAVIGGLGAVAMAQDETPTSTPKESLPNPVRIWTSSNPLVLAPVASASDDERRTKKTQTADGEFRGRCPGAARLRITSGFETSKNRVVVRSKPGPIVDSIAIRGRRAEVHLEQRAEVLVRVRTSSGRVVRTLGHGCKGAGRHEFRWRGKAKPGRYALEVVIRYDRKPITRAEPIRIR